MSATLASLLSCTGVPTEPPTTRGLSVAVAPLELPGIGFACYDLAVSNGVDTVWSRGVPAVKYPVDTATVCSDDFGNGGGGAISYVGPCDATVDADGDDTNGVQNLVTLWVDGLYNSSGVPIEAGADNRWQNPCGAAGCKLYADCEENADTLVEFNLTIMRDANQGFFDVAVNFEDIFCSAKVDCAYADGRPIELLFDGPDRAQTAVLAFACSSGVGDTTVLNVSDIVVDCGSFEIPLDPTAGPGNIGPRATAVFEHATYRGKEQFATDAGFDKCYWNTAIGLDLAAMSTAEGCRLRARATATEALLTNGQTAPGHFYPYIDINVPLTAPGSSTRLCDQHPLNVEGSGVTTEYTHATAEPESFCHYMLCDGTNTVGTYAGCGAPPTPLDCVSPGDADGRMRVLWYHAAFDNVGMLDDGSVNDLAFRDTIADLEAGLGWEIDVWYLGSADPATGDVVSFNGPPGPIADYDVLFIESEESALLQNPYTGVSWDVAEEIYTPIIAAKAEIEAVRGSRTVVTGSDVDFHAHEYRRSPDYAVDYTSHMDGARVVDGSDGLLSNMIQWAMDGTGLGVVMATTIGWYTVDFPNGMAGNPGSFLHEELAAYWSDAYNSYEDIAFVASQASHPIHAGLSEADLEGWPNHGVISFAIEAEQGYVGLQTTTGSPEPVPNAGGPVGFVTAVKELACGCGNGYCQFTETPASCPVDCPSCGDGVCSANETVAGCPADCQLFAWELVVAVDEVQVSDPPPAAQALAELQSIAGVGAVMTATFGWDPNTDPTGGDQYAEYQWPGLEGTSWVLDIAVAGVDFTGLAGSGGTTQVDVDASYAWVGSYSTAMTASGLSATPTSVSCDVWLEDYSTPYFLTSEVLPVALDLSDFAPIVGCNLQFGDGSSYGFYGHVATSLVRTSPGP